MTSEQRPDRRFTRDEVGEIVEMAARLDGLNADDPGIDYEELRRIAQELGISDRSLLEVVAARTRDQAQVNEEATQKRRAVMAWKQHIVSYAAVITGLAALDWFSGGGFTWFFYPAAGWGIGLLIHTLNLWWAGDTSTE